MAAEPAIQPSALEAVFAAGKQLLKPPADAPREMGLHTLKENAPASRAAAARERF